jgi:transcriptional regulator with XRE-family HTH domain
MNNSKSLIERLFHTEEDRNTALGLDYDVQIAHSITMARQYRNMTQHELALTMDVSQSYVAQLENASVLPSHTKLKLIAQKLKARLLPPKIVIEDSSNESSIPTIKYSLSDDCGKIIAIYPATKTQTLCPSAI